MWAAEYGTVDDLDNACRHFGLYYNLCRQMGINCLTITEYEGFEKAHLRPIIRYHCSAR